MGRIRKGSIVEREGTLYAVIQHVDETGRKEVRHLKYFLRRELLIGKTLNIIGSLPNVVARIMSLYETPHPC